MQSFKEYLEERVLSIGIKPEHEPMREKHRQEIHDIIKRSYNTPELNGYGSLGHGTPAASKAIHDDISKSMIKATRRDGKITSASLYSDKHGRKVVASGTDGSDQGKKDFLQNKKDDGGQKRAWAEVSGKIPHILAKLGYPKVSNDQAEKLTGKKILSKNPDGFKYTRHIGGHEHEKEIMGYPNVK